MSHTFASLNAALEGRYRIERELGAGGMATVYLAQDVRHERQVAIKVLKPELVAIIGADRFLAEIKTTANLQHPHILPLHDSGEADGVLYYVMPYVEGESLRAKLDREQQLPVAESVRIAAAVAGALDYAHGHGVIHRDIKPANILLHGSQPVVADFGIALAVGAAGGSRLTETGLSVGTLQYMSPEQAVGDREIDGRSDLYSLATTLYELLVGEAPFSAPTPQAVVGRIISQAAPSAVELRETVPAHVARAIQKALAKLPADRFQTGAEFADALARPGATEGLTVGTHASAAGDKPTGGGWKTAVPAALAIAALGFAAGAILTGDRSSDGASDPVEFVMRLGERMNHVFALSQDGRQLAFSGQSGGLLTRTMGSPQVRVIPASDGRVWGQPTFSPDGEWVAFFDVEESELRRVPFRGGTPVTIASVPLLLFGMSWGPDDTIVWGRGFTGLWSVAVDGGSPVPLTVPDSLRGELGHWDPQFLPGGSSVLFTTYRVPVDSAAVEVLDLESGQRTVLFQGGVHARYASTGHILYSRGEALWAVPFDADSRRVEGAPVRVLEGVSYDPTNARGGFEISANGTLVYMG
ncbi:MAG: protein kinase domain-containing protein, partial [Longimicrobiales bacterium]